MAHRPGNTPQHAPPCDLEAEELVLAACVISPACADRALEALAPEHFFSQENAHIFEAYVDLDRRGRAVELAGVVALLGDRGLLDRVNLDRLTSLPDDGIEVAQVGDAILRLRKTWRLRAVAAMCMRFARKARTHQGDVDSLLDRLSGAIVDLTRKKPGRLPSNLGESCDQVFKAFSGAAERGESKSGIPTGRPEIDRRRGGLQRGKLVVVRGRPGADAGAFVVEIAGDVALRATRASVEEAVHDVGVAVFSTACRPPTGQRIACRAAGVDMAHSVSGQLRNEDWARLTSAAAEIGNAPLYVDDSPVASPQQLQRRLRIIAEHLSAHSDSHPSRELGLMVIEDWDLPGKRGRRWEIHDLLTALKGIAQEFDLAVLVALPDERSRSARERLDAAADVVVVLRRDGERPQLGASHVDIEVPG